MKRPLIFSGTTEGRQMSERLSAAGIDHIVCVATEYGELVMQPDPHADVRRGRLDREEMCRLMSEEVSEVFDATHPYAAAVSENIRQACEKTGTGYLRIIRTGPREIPDEGITVFEDAASCAEALKDTEGNILLTTGSKDIAIYAADPGVRSRLYARVLPSEESIRLCNAAGISGKKIIAMQGPFSCEMDMAVIRQYGIGVMVTKSSGTAGGFAEKIRAARECGIPVYVIGRPAEEQGLPVNDALEMFFGIKPVMHIDLVGTGPGRESLMTEEAREAARNADILFGASRMIGPYAAKETYPFYFARDIIPVLEERRPERAAVLFSGDTGFCSGASKMMPELEAWFTENGYDHEIQLHPGISSFAYLAAKTGLPYTDAGLCSMHGRTGDDRNTKEIIDTIRTHDRTFLLLSGADDIRLLGSTISEHGLGDCWVMLGRRLSYPDERTEALTPEECAHVTEDGLYTAVILNGSPESEAAEAEAAETGGLLMPVLDDDSFERGKVPMTKENVRHLSILKLGLAEGSVLYDIGSGTGSIACEAANLSDTVRVYAVEMKPEACALIKENMEKFGLKNITVTEGKAPEALEDIEAPTHAFVGGSSGDLKEIINCLNAKASAAGRGIRVVINAVSLETMAEIQSVMKEFEISDSAVEQISVSRSRELGSYHLMTAENPVMIASFTFGGNAE